VSCRLTALLARDVPLAVILRRGPTRRVQLILWHTDSDTFAEGQWFYGRIYEWGCDLSPDGRHFLYLARKTETPERRASTTTHKWTALSHPPYFTALALWPHGDDWEGGGVFRSDRSLWLNYDRRKLKKRLYKDISIVAGSHPQGFRARSLRDGWEIAQEGKFSSERLPDGVPGPALRIRAITHQPVIWRKYRPDRQYCLVEESYREADFTFTKLTYLVDEATGRQDVIDETTWSDWDQQGRLVLARAGKLFVSLNTDVHPLSMHEIADFNNNRPTPLIAPYKARRW
jgi:hypothetical protein